MHLPWVLGVSPFLFPFSHPHPLFLPLPLLLPLLPLLLPPSPSLLPSLPPFSLLFHPPPFFLLSLPFPFSSLSTLIYSLTLCLHVPVCSQLCTPDCGISLELVRSLVTYSESLVIHKL